MQSSTSAISNESLTRLHSNCIDDAGEIRAILEAAWHAASRLESRLNLALEPQVAHIVEIDADTLHLSTERFDAEQPSQIFLNLALDGRLYFFSVAKRSHAPDRDRLCVRLPSVLFYTERRDHPRRPPSTSRNDTTRVELRASGRALAAAEVEDLSAEGMLIRVSDDRAAGLPDGLEVGLLDGEAAGQRLFARVRHEKPAPEVGWRRIGLATSSVATGAPIPVDRRDAILPTRTARVARRRVEMLGAGVRLATGRTWQRLTGRKPALPEIRTVAFENPLGERIVGIVDACGEVRGAPLVLMPPAWAKTKETLLPLARTIVDSFRRAGRSVAVVRLDGIRRRGESHNDPECAAPGSECHHMTFHQGASDIRAAIEYFRHAPEFAPSHIVLVTFSGAAIEARRALCEVGTGKTDGWVSVVGAADLKSGLRTVSGGVDYIGGAERGVQFGMQRVLGIEVDIDRVAADAVSHRMAYLEDARREMAQLELPITWIQGRYDAWIDPDRVRDVLSCGDVSRRKLIEVPTGHQLRSSQEALETFQLVAREIGRIVLGTPIDPCLPDLVDLERRRRAERARLPKAEVELRDFWRDYLLGRERRLGMELLTISTPYRQLMQAQVAALVLQPGMRVGDLGSGTGALPLHLLASGALAEPGPRGNGSEPTAIDEIDYVPEALERAKQRLAAACADANANANANAKTKTKTEARTSDLLRVRYLECDLDRPAHERPVPVPDGSYDRVLASLLLNYLGDPEALLAEARRVLRPGGRIVVSTLRRDVDISRIYQEVAAELQAGAAREALGAADERLVEADLRDFLNEAARLVDLEERGVFHFWSTDELVDLLVRAGFTDVETTTSFGEPPQAIVASAVRP